MKATVVNLTFNAKPWIKDWIEACLNQESDFDYEILIIDSGSTDGTLEVIKQYDDKLRLHRIPNSEFGHGKTRNLAASMAKGEFVLFLTHDAIPATRYWLKEMLSPFELNEKVAAVYGKQIPRPDCCPAVKRDIIGVFSGFGADYMIMLQQANPLTTDQAAKDALTFFSDVNSAVRKSILLGAIPYQDLNYSEDYAFGRDIINSGLIKAYAPLGAVIHSHSYPPLKYFRRMYDEMVGLKKATGQTLDSPLWFHFAWILKATLKDWVFISRDKDYLKLAKAKWLLQAPLYNIYRRTAIRLATKDALPAWAHAFLSLEHRARKKAA